MVLRRAAHNDVLDPPARSGRSGCRGELQPGVRRRGAELGDAGIPQNDLPLLCGAIGVAREPEGLGTQHDRWHVRVEENLWIEQVERCRSTEFLQRGGEIALLQGDLVAYRAAHTIGTDDARADAPS
jgi:hypothetical protein